MGHVDTRAFLNLVRSQIFALFASMLLSFPRMRIDYWARIIRHTETSVSGGYLTHILVNLKSESKQKHHQKFVGGILILHKNALSHNHKLAQAIIEQCEFEELSHPVCGIDQTSSKHCLIRHLKNHTG